MLDFFPPQLWEGVRLAFKYLYQFAPIWLPATFGFKLFESWVGYRRAAYWQGMGAILLEIKLPKDVFKSPAAMEIILGALHQTADESGWYFKYWKGQTRTWFSLELVSIGGEIHFYIWSRKKYKTSIENHFYSQYPGAEVYEVPDYASEYQYSPATHDLWAAEWKLSKPDPYPIKTYVDYGMDKDPDEEYKVDPMASMLEFLGSTTAGHNVWFQILIRAHKKEKSRPLPWTTGGKPKVKTKWSEFAWSEEYDAWQEEAKKEIKEIIEKFKPAEGPVRQPTEGEKETINALERSTSKYPFDVGIRTVYVAEKEVFNSGPYIGGIIGSFKQFGSQSGNGFEPSGWMSYFNRPWKKWRGRDEKLKPFLIEEYKLRRYFFSPHDSKYYYSKPFVLNTEELATIYHLPGSTVATPTLKRVPSKKSEAPSNLPI